MVNQCKTEKIVLDNHKKRFAGFKKSGVREHVTATTYPTTYSSNLKVILSISLPYYCSLCNATLVLDFKFTNNQIVQVFDITFWAIVFCVETLYIVLTFCWPRAHYCAALLCVKKISRKYYSDIIYINILYYIYLYIFLIFSAKYLLNI